MFIKRNGLAVLYLKVDWRIGDAVGCNMVSYRAQLEDVKTLSELPANLAAECLIYSGTVSQSHNPRMPLIHCHLFPRSLLSKLSRE